MVAREINKSMPIASDWSDFVYFSCYVWIQALLMNINFPQNFPLALIGCLRAHAANPALGSSVALGFQYCLDLFCTLCLNYIFVGLDNFNSTIMLLCGFHWHSRYSNLFLGLLVLADRDFLLPFVVSVVGSGWQGFPAAIHYFIYWFIYFIHPFI